MRYAPDSQRPLGYHLAELRSRLLWSVAFWVLACSISYQLRDILIHALQSPVKDTLYYTSPTGGFQLVFGVVIIAGFIISLPFIVYQALSFVAPALSPGMHKRVYAATGASIILTLIGVGFGYKFGLPSTLKFLSGFSSVDIKQLLTLDSYVSFVSHYLIAFALAFQMPVVVYAVSLFYPLTVQMMLKGERWVILLSFIAAAFISPSPDILNQTMVAGPIIILYQLSLLVVYIAERGRAQKPKTPKVPRSLPPAPKPPMPVEPRKEPVRKNSLDGIARRQK